MRGTRGGQGGGRNRALSAGQHRNHVALIELGGGRAIEADKADVGVRVEKGAEVVRDRIIRYVRIETSRTSQSAMRCSTSTRTRPAYSAGSPGTHAAMIFQKEFCGFA
jgi:hypothetical protein